MRTATLALLVTAGAAGVASAGPTVEVHVGATVDVHVDASVGVTVGTPPPVIVAPPPPPVIVAPPVVIAGDAGAAIDVTAGEYGDAGVATDGSADAGFAAGGGYSGGGYSGGGYSGGGYSSGGYSGGGSELTFDTPLSRSHWEAGVAMTVPMGFGDIGLHAAVGRAFGPLRLAGEYTLDSASADRTVSTGWTSAVMADCGQRQRLGLGARYRVDMGLATMGTGVYVEAGVGRATTTWKSGAESTRKDVLLGLGFELLGGGQRLIGMDLGARFTIAEAEQPGAAKDTTGLITIGLLVGG